MSMTTDNNCKKNIDSLPGGLQQWISFAKRHELNKIATLRLLLETCNVSETARRLNTSQSAVSRILEKMRNDLEDPLLIKSSNRMLLTKRAMSLIPILDQLLSVNYYLFNKDKKFDPSKEQRIFHIGANDFTQLILGKGLLATIREIAPYLTINMESIKMEGIMDKLTDGHLDLVIGFGPSDYGELRSQVLTSGDIVCLASDKNKLPAEKLSIAELSSYPFVEVRPGGTGFIESSIDRVFSANRLIRQKMAVISSYLAVPAMIAETDLLFFAPRLILSHIHLINNKIKVVETDFPLPKYNIAMYWHNISHCDPSLIWLRHEINRLEIS